MTTVLLVDDHSVVIEGLTMLLASFDDLDVVASASTATGIVECYRSHRPDVVLMDLSMPVVDGVEATSLLRSEFPDARVIVLTGSTDPYLVGAALDAGACGFLMKSASGDDIAEAIRSEGIVSMLTVPIRARDEVIGVMRLLSEVERDFPEDMIMLVNALAVQGGIAIQNASLYLRLDEDKKSLEEDIWSYRSWF